MQHSETGNTYALKTVSKGLLTTEPCVRPDCPCMLAVLAVCAGYILAANMKGAIANEKDVLYMTSSPFIIKLYAAQLDHMH